MGFADPVDYIVVSFEEIMPCCARRTSRTHS